MFQEHPVNKPVATPHFLQEDKMGGVIEEMGVIAGRVALDDEEKAEGVVLDDVKTAIP